MSKYPGIETTADGAASVVWVETSITQGACARGGRSELASRVRRRTAGSRSLTRPSAVRFLF